MSRNRGRLIPNDSPALGVGRAEDLVHLLLKGGAGDHFSAWDLHTFCVDGGAEPGGGEDHSAGIYVEFKDGAGKAAVVVRADGDRNVFAVPGDDLAIVAGGGGGCLFAEMAEDGGCVGG